MNIFYEVTIIFCAVALGMNLEAILVYPENWVAYGMGILITMACIAASWVFLAQLPK